MKSPLQLPSEKNNEENVTSSSSSSSSSSSLFRLTKFTSKASSRGLSLRTHNTKSTIANEATTNKRRHRRRRPKHRNYFADVEDQQQKIPIPNFSPLSPDRVVAAAAGGTTTRRCKSSSLSESLLEKVLQDDDDDDDACLEFLNHNKTITAPPLKRTQSKQKEQQPISNNTTTNITKRICYNIDNSSSEEDDDILATAVFPKSQQSKHKNVATRTKTKTDTPSESSPQQIASSNKSSLTPRKTGDSDNHKSDSSSPQPQIAQLTQSAIEEISEWTTSTTTTRGVNAPTVAPLAHPAAELTQSAVEEVSEWTTTHTAASTPQPQQFSNNNIKPSNQHQKNTSLSPLVELTQSAIEEVSEWSTANTQVESATTTNDSRAGKSTVTTTTTITTRMADAKKKDNTSRRKKTIIKDDDDNMKVSELTQTAIEEISEWTTAVRNNNHGDSSSEDELDNHHCDNQKNCDMETSLSSSSAAAVIQSSPPKTSSCKKQKSSSVSNSCTILTTPPKTPNTRLGNNKDQQQPTPHSLMASVDHLYSHVDDPENVTIKEIMIGIEAEYNVKLQKSHKALVRYRLKELLVAMSQSQSLQTKKQRGVNDIAAVLKTVHALFDNVAPHDITTITIGDILQGVQETHDIQLNKNDKKLIRVYLKDWVTNAMTTTQHDGAATPPPPPPPPPQISSAEILPSEQKMSMTAVGNVASKDSSNTDRLNTKVVVDTSSDVAYRSTITNDENMTTAAVANSKNKVSNITTKTKPMQQHQKQPSSKLSLEKFVSGPEQDPLSDAVDPVTTTVDHGEKQNSMGITKTGLTVERLEYDVEVVVQQEPTMPPHSPCREQQAPIVARDCDTTRPSKEAKISTTKLHDTLKETQPVPLSEPKKPVFVADVGIAKQKKQTTLKRKRQLKERESSDVCCIDLIAGGETAKQASPTTAPKKMRRPRAKKGSCAMCNTCSCQTGNTLDTSQTLGLGNLSKSVRDVENALIRRVKKLEKTKDWYEDLTDQVRRDLRKHRRAINKDRESKLSAKHGANNKASSNGNSVDWRFLPDADEWDAQIEGAQAPPLETSRISEAQHIVFATQDNQQPKVTNFFGKTSGSEDQNEDEGGGGGEERSNDAIMVQGCDSKTDGAENQLSEDCESDNKKEDNNEVIQTSEAESEEVVEDRIHRMAWRGGAQKDTDDVNGSPIRGHGAWGAMSTKNRRQKTCYDADEPFSVGVVGISQFAASFDQLFEPNDNADNNGDGLEDLLNMFEDPSLLPSQSNPADCQGDDSSSEEKSDSAVDISMLSQQRQSTAKSIEDNVVSDPTKHSVIEDACPNWRENVRYALAQTDKQGVQDALNHVASTKARLAAAKKKMLDLFSRQEVVLQLHETSLEESLRHLTSGSKIDTSKILSAISSGDEQE